MTDIPPALLKIAGRRDDQNGLHRREWGACTPAEHNRASAAASTTGAWCRSCPASMNGERFDLRSRALPERAQLAAASRRGSRAPGSRPKAADADGSREFLDALAGRPATVSPGMSSRSRISTTTRRCPCRTHSTRCACNTASMRWMAPTALFDSFRGQPVLHPGRAVLAAARPQPRARADAQHRRRCGGSSPDVGMTAASGRGGACGPKRPGIRLPAPIPRPRNSRCGRAAAATRSWCSASDEDRFSRHGAAVCPHQQFPLSDAILQGGDAMLRCRRHSYVFRLSDGKGINCQGYRLKVYEVKQEKRRRCSPAPSGNLTSSPCCPRSRAASRPTLSPELSATPQQRDQHQESANTGSQIEAEVWLAGSARMMPLLLAPTNSPTMAPITTSTMPVFRPAMMYGRAFGNCT